MSKTNHNRFLIFVAILLAMSAVLSVWTPAALANAGGDSGAYANTKSRCQQIKQQIYGSDQDGIVLSEYIVECTKTVVREVFTQFINAFYPHLETAIMASLTLAVTLFGVLQLTGALEKPSRDAFVTLFKLACVLFFIKPETVQEIFDMGMDSMDGLTDLVFQYGKNSTSQRCFDNSTVWDRVDCMLDVLIGLKGTDGEAKTLGGFLGGGAGGAPETGSARGLMHFATTAMASKGGMGFVIGGLIFYIAYTMVMATIKSVHTYLAAIVGLAFVLVFAPMFVPMIMFRVTKNFFDKWQRIATSFILQPVILFGFLSFMMIAMDKMLISGDGSLLKTAFGNEGDSKTKVPGKIVEERGGYVSNRQSFGMGRGNLARAADNIGGSVQNAGVMGSKHYKAARKDDPKSRDVRTSSFFSHFPAYDWSKLCKGGGDGAKCSASIGYSVLVVALTAFVFISMLNYIPNLATDLAGGLYEVPNLFESVGQHLPGKEMLEQKMGAAASGAQAEFKRRFAELLGTRR